VDVSLVDVATSAINVSLVDVTASEIVVPSSKTLVVSNGSESRSCSAVVTSSDCSVVLSVKIHDRNVSTRFPVELTAQIIKFGKIINRFMISQNLVSFSTLQILCLVSQICLNRKDHVLGNGQ